MAEVSEYVLHVTKSKQIQNDLTNQQIIDANTELNQIFGSDVEVTLQSGTNILIVKSDEI